MRKYRVAWLPGDGIGPEVCTAARYVLDAAGFDADYLHGDIGWEFWVKEGDALPARTLDLLRNTDCAFFWRDHFQACLPGWPGTYARTAGQGPRIQ